MAEAINPIRSARKGKRWSQQDLAAAAGISRSAVSAIETGTLVPSVAAALGLARALECSVETLFGAAHDEDASSPRWAWEPAALPCRYWSARLQDRTLHFPVEGGTSGTTPHDGVWDGRSPLQPIHSELPGRTLVLASCDPAAGLLVDALRERGVRLLVLQRSSRDGLDLLRRGVVHLAGLHLATLDAPQRNLEAVRDELGEGFALLRVARWQEGVVVDAGNSHRSVEAVIRARTRWVSREPGSGARHCQDELLGRERQPRRLAYHHRGVADCVRWGWADAGVCLRITGEEAGLRFLPVQEESYDLCYPASLFGDPRLQALLACLRSRSFRRMLGELPGYDSRDAGVIQKVPKSPSFSLGSQNRGLGVVQ